jgi:hypothetical protein
VQYSPIVEANMILRTLIFLGFAGFIGQPALAQTAPTAAPARITVTATIDSLLASGYEVKAVTVMSDAATKEVYPNQTSLPSQIFVTLQKGDSVAVCEGMTFNWLSLSDSLMTDVTRCFRR